MYMYRLSKLECGFVFFFLEFSIYILDVFCNSFYVFGVEFVLCCLNFSYVISLNLTGIVTVNGVIYLFFYYIEMFFS